MSAIRAIFPNIYDKLEKYSLLLLGMKEKLKIRKASCKNTIKYISTITF